MTRKEAREQVFILIFEKLFRDEPVETILEDAALVRDLEPEEYIRRVFCGAVEKSEEIDEMISAAAKGWSLNRISKTALAAMRLCIFEMLYCDDIPVSVSINESVEIIKKYATKEDATFANGILGTISRNVADNNG
jgi:N utilization substance protein B